MTPTLLDEEAFEAWAKHALIDEFRSDERWMAMFRAAYFAGHRGRPAQIEITPAMIEAGASALMQSGYRNEFMDIGATQAVQAVLAAVLETIRSPSPT